MSSKTPKILIFDIETSPNIVYCWRTGYKLTVTPESIIQERQIICIAYKWSGEKRTHLLTWNPKKKEDKDKQLLKEFSKVYNQADMTVAYNGNSFDTKWIKGRIMYHKLKPLAPVKQCDPMLEIRRTVSLNSNKMDYVSKFLGYEGKSPMSYSDWTAIMDGSCAALKKMGKYCRQDVEVLDTVFQETRPYIENGNIHQAKKGDRDVCPSCGAGRTLKYGIYYTKTGQFQKYRCMGCFHNWRDTRMLKVK